MTNKAAKHCEHAARHHKQGANAGAAHKVGAVCLFVIYLEAIAPCAEAQQALALSNSIDMRGDGREIAEAPEFHVGRHSSYRRYE